MTGITLFYYNLIVVGNERFEIKYQGSSGEKTTVLSIGLSSGSFSFIRGHIDTNLEIYGTIKHIRALDKFNMKGEIKILLTFVDQ